MLYLTNLLLADFRNYRQQEMQFHPRLNIIVGENAQGKTNLLEAIYYLAVTRSFRTHRDQEMVRRDTHFFLIKGHFLKNSVVYAAQTSYQSIGQLQIKINSVPANRLDYVHQFPVVIFSPDDLMLIREGPLVRRRFINLEASRLSAPYLRQLKDYQRVLLHRNQILRGKYSRYKIDELLEPWDQALVNLGSSIIKKRLEILQSLEKEAQIFFDRMTKCSEKLSLEYTSSVKYSKKKENIEKSFHEQLINRRGREINRGSTLLGPHLDDIKILINDYDTKRYSSQGQKRTAVLALRMGEASLFYKQNNETPIILLDDVFSEFDSERKKYFLDFLRENEAQCFITTTADTKELIANLHREHKIISVRQGNIVDERAGTDS